LSPKNTLSRVELDTGFGLCQDKFQNTMSFYSPLHKSAIIPSIFIYLFFIIAVIMLMMARHHVVLPEIKRLM
jgi:hypothetical protein